MHIIKLINLHTDLLVSANLHKAGRAWTLDVVCLDDMISRDNFRVHNYISRDIPKEKANHQHPCQRGFRRRLPNCHFHLIHCPRAKITKLNRLRQSNYTNVIPNICKNVRISVNFNILSSFSIYCMFHCKSTC